MKTPQEIFEILKTTFGESLFTQNTGNLYELTIDVNPSIIRDVCSHLKYEPELLFDSLVVLSALDDANGKKNTLPDGSFEFEGGTLSVYYHLESTSLKHKVVLKVSVPREKPEVESVTSIWHHANFEEREAYDMIGIIFLNHPDLRRILLPYDWESRLPIEKRL